MPQQHLDRALLDAVFTRGLSPERLIPIALGHLLDLCPHCEEEFNAWRSDAAAPSPTSYGEVFARIEEYSETAEETVCREFESARAHFCELLSLPDEKRIEHVLSAPDQFRSPILAELLVEESHRAVANHPHAALGFSQLAKAVLQHGEPGGAEIDLYARAMSHTANALRACGLLLEAGEMFQDARFLLSSTGGGDRLLFAEIDRLQGYLHKAERQLPTAVALLERAATAYELAKADRERVTTEINLGLTYRELGALKPAFEAFRTAFELSRQLQDQKLIQYSRHNLGLIFCEMGRFGDAQACVLANRQSVDFEQEPLFELRTLWLEGLIAAGVGEFVVAENLLAAARHGFSERRLSYDESLVARDIAQVWLDREE